jgi:hypothetical protein
MCHMMQHALIEIVARSHLAWISRERRRCAV